MRLGFVTKNRGFEVAAWAESQAACVSAEVKPGVITGTYATARAVGPFRGKFRARNATTTAHRGARVRTATPTPGAPFLSLPTGISAPAAYITVDVS